MKNHRNRYLFWTKCVLIIAAAVGYGTTRWNFLPDNYLPIVAKAQTRDQPKTSRERFDDLVRNDFFAGMMGDIVRLDRGMKFCEDILAKDPKHVEALVWHGGGLIARASQAYRKGDSKLGDALWNRGIKEMNDAVAFEPDRIDVKIGRSATIIGLAQAGWDKNDVENNALLRSAVLDYEKVYEAQKAGFDKLWSHSRGELLFGLASGWSILGEHQKARQYLQLIVERVKGSDYETEAQRWLDKKPMVIEHDCRGCHLTE